MILLHFFWGICGKGVEYWSTSLLSRLVFCMIGQVSGYINVCSEKGSEGAANGKFVHLEIAMSSSTMAISIAEYIKVGRVPFWESKIPKERWSDDLGMG